jgi:hypothetical protein
MRAHKFGFIVDPTFYICDEHCKILEPKLPANEDEMWKLFRKWQEEGIA